MKSIPFFLFLFLYGSLSFAQNKFLCLVKDSATNELLGGVNITVVGTRLGAQTNNQGEGTLQNIPSGEQIVQFTFVGYQKIERTFIFPLVDSLKRVVIFLSEEGRKLEEVVVSTSRTNSRIDDLSTKVEVLGPDDMEEESTVVPGSVTSILGDLAIITIQRTDPINGNEAIRMQGLDARYTQIMRDGLPLYGGFSGSLGVLSIPPLDLKQVEIIKGSSSTLYGGGAMGGLINFISKSPADSAHTTLTVNTTSLQEYNLNAFTSKKSGKLGLTLFGGANFKSPKDINGDGFTEVPEQNSITWHPRLFYALNKKNKLMVGLTTTYDTRIGGDMNALLYKPDSVHLFLQKEKALRNTVEATYRGQLSEQHLLTLKSAGSIFTRTLDQNDFFFKGTQYSTYSEVNDFIKLRKRNLVVGGNFTSEAFEKGPSDSVLFQNYAYQTLGLFAQDEWKLTKHFSVQSGLRFDHHNKYGNFLLPRLSLFYKSKGDWSIRLAGGTGYKVPNQFDLANPAKNLGALGSLIKPEKSMGVNSDFNCTIILFEKLKVQLNEALYYTHINSPITLVLNSMGQQVLQNANYKVNSYGTDTYIRLIYEELELYLGYNHTISLQEASTSFVYMPFNPKDKLSTTFSYEIEGKWRMGVEASWMGNQFITDNQKVPSFWFLAGMLERKFKHGSVVLNCENISNTRQSKFESLVTGTTSHPIFKPIWGPVEGRVLNLSLKVTL